MPAYNKQIDKVHNSVLDGLRFFLLNCEFSYPLTSCARDFVDDRCDIVDTKQALT